MFLSKIPPKLMLQIVNKLDNNTIKNFGCLDKHHHQLVKPILAKRKEACFARVYICDRLRTINDDENFYDERYFEFAAKLLKLGQLFKTYDEAFYVQFREGVLCALYAAAVPFKHLDIQASGNIFLKDAYDFTKEDIEGVYLLHIKKPNRYRPNPAYTRHSKELALLLDDKLTEQPKAKDIIQPTKNKQTCTLL